MSDDAVKLLALVFTGVVGYWYALRAQENAALRVKKEAEHEETKLRTETKKASLPDLIRRANERLRERRDREDK